VYLLHWTSGVNCTFLFPPTGLRQNILENNKQRGFKGVLFHAFPKADAQGISILEKLKNILI